MGKIDFPGSSVLSSRYGPVFFSPIIVANSSKFKDIVCVELRSTFQTTEVLLRHIVGIYWNQFKDIVELKSPILLESLLPEFFQKYCKAYQNI